LETSSLDTADKALDFLIIDADCGDMSIGMSAPPECFVTLDFLRDARRALRDEGLLLPSRCIRTGTVAVVD
jgi:hypothetical protein